MQDGAMQDKMTHADTTMVDEEARGRISLLLGNDGMIVHNVLHIHCKVAMRWCD